MSDPGSGVVAIRSPQEMAQFVNDEAGNRNCFGMRCALSNGETVWCEFHGCNNFPRILDVFTSWAGWVLHGGFSHPLCIISRRLQ